MSEPVPGGGATSRDLFISVDLDGLHHHLRGYGEECAPPPRNVVYEVALPRIAALFRRLDLSATFFAVGEDAAAHAAALRQIAADGHEVASQSQTHPLPFTALPPEQIEREVSDSRRELERVIGRPVHGFRAPGFGATKHLFAAVARAGYAYDSSVFASPVHLATMLLIASQRPALASALPLAFSSRLPHRLPGGLWEAPMSATPGLRLPFYQTLAVAFGASRFDLAMRGLLRRAEPLHHVFHGIDFLADGEIEPRLRRHPGARVPLDEKILGIETRLRRYREGRTSVTLAQRFAEEATTDEHRSTR